MVYNYWPILLVDDEPDILIASKMALKGLVHCGLPVKVYAFGSKEEAIEFMRGNEWIYGHFISFALIDVVMETDEAGLELCDLIRSNMSNFFTQLYIRTGQAAKYSELDVLSRFSVDGYITKMEATRERILTIVKTGISNFLYKLVVNAYLLSLQVYTVLADQSQEALLTRMRQDTKSLNLDPNGLPAEHAHSNLCQFYGDIIWGGGVFEKNIELACEVREKLMSLTPRFRSPAGDILIEHDGYAYFQPAIRADGRTGLAWLFKSKMSVSQELFEVHIKGISICANVLDLARSG